MGRRKLETWQLLKSKKSVTKNIKQRKDGIMKKAFELSTLCDVQVGVIIFGPNAADSPDIWPQNSETLINIIRKYQSTSVEERRKRTVNVSHFNSSTSSNVQEGYCEVKPENPIWNDKFDSLSVEQLLDMVSSLDSKIEVVKTKINLLKNQQFITSPESDEVVLSSSSSSSSSSSYTGGVQQGVLMMNDSILPRFQCDDYHLVVDDQYSVSQFLEQQRYADLMMMMNDDRFCDLSNNVDVGDYSWNNFDGVMFDNPSPMTWWRGCNPACLMQEQALQFDAAAWWSTTATLKL